MFLQQIKNCNSFFSCAWVRLVLTDIQYCIFRLALFDEPGSRKNAFNSHLWRRADMAQFIFLQQLNAAIEPVNQREFLLIFRHVIGRCLGIASESMPFAYPPRHCNGHCHQALPPNTQVTPFIHSCISSVLCNVHSAQADGSVSQILATARKLSLISRSFALKLASECEESQ